MNPISELKIREIIRSQLIERYGVLNEQQPPGWTSQQVEEIQALLITLHGAEDNEESINALLNVSDGQPDGQWGSSTTSAWNLAPFPPGATGLPEWNNSMTYEEALSAIQAAIAAEAEDASEESAEESEPDPQTVSAAEDSGDAAPDFPEAYTVGALVTAWRDTTEERHSLAKEYAQVLQSYISTQRNIFAAYNAGSRPPMEPGVDYEVLIYPMGGIERVIEAAGLAAEGSGDPDDETPIPRSAISASAREEGDQHSSSNTYMTILYNLAVSIIAYSTPATMRSQIEQLTAYLNSSRSAEEAIASLRSQESPDEEAIADVAEDAEDDIESAANTVEEMNPAVAAAVDSAAPSAVEGETDVDEEPEEPDAASAASTQDEREVSDDIGTSGVGEEVRRVPLELLTVEDRNGNPAFRIRLPASFVGNFENQRGFIGRIFGSDTLNQFVENPRSTGKDQPFVINWGGYPGAPADTMFAQTTETLGDLQDIGFEEDMGIGRVRGPVKDAFNTVKAQRKAARKAYEDKDKERRRGDATQAEVTAASAEAARIRDIEQFMRGSRYERLRIRRKDGTSQDLFRFTPASRRKDGTPPVTAADLQAIDTINAGRLDSLREAKRIKEKIYLERLIRDLIKEK